MMKYTSKPSTTSLTMSILMQQALRRYSFAPRKSIAIPSLPFLIIRPTLAMLQLLYAQSTHMALIFTPSLAPAAPTTATLALPTEVYVSTADTIVTSTTLPVPAPAQNTRALSISLW